MDLLVPGTASVLVAAALLIFSIYLYRLIIVTEDSVETERDGIQFYVAAAAGSPIAYVFALAFFHRFSGPALESGILYYMGITILAFAVGLSLLAIVRTSIEVSNQPG